jgi:hypothetical protein
LICTKYKGFYKDNVYFNDINNKNELKELSKKHPIIGDVKGGLLSSKNSCQRCYENGMTS